MLGNDCFCLLIRLINDTLYFHINGRGNSLTVAVCMCQITSDKYFIVIIFVADQADIFGLSQVQQADLDAFKKMYGIDGEIEKEY